MVSAETYLVISRVITLGTVTGFQTCNSTRLWLNLFTCGQKEAAEIISFQSLSDNLLVVGSNPTGPTRNTKDIHS